MRNNTKKNVYIGLFAAISFVLYYFEVSTAIIFPAAPFLKIDFSDIPALFSGVMFGPVSAVIVELIKNILHALIISKEPMFSGEIGNFISNVIFILPIIIYYNKNKEVKLNKYVIVLTLSVLMASLVMCLVNYFITLPLYGINENSVKLAMIYSSFLPFNILKGYVLGAVFFLLYKSLKKFIKGEWFIFKITLLLVILSWFFIYKII